MKTYFDNVLKRAGSRPGYAHTLHFFNVIDPCFYEDFKSGKFTKQDLIDYADSYYYNFGGEVDFYSGNEVKVKVYTD